MATSAEKPNSKKENKKQEEGKTISPKTIIIALSIIVVIQMAIILGLAFTVANSSPSGQGRPSFDDSNLPSDFDPSSLPEDFEDRPRGFRQDQEAENSDAETSSNTI